MDKRVLAFEIKLNKLLIINGFSYNQNMHFVYFERVYSNNFAS